MIGHRLGSSTDGIGFFMVLNSTRQFLKYVHLSNVEPVLYIIAHIKVKK